MGKLKNRFLKSWEFLHGKAPDVSSNFSAMSRPINLDYSLAANVMPNLTGADTGLNHWAINTCLSLYMEQISSCTPYIIDENNNEIFQPWLIEPNSRQTHREMLSEFTYYLVYFGDDYVESSYFSDGSIKEINLNNPQDVSLFYINTNGRYNRKYPIKYTGLDGKTFFPKHVKYKDVGYANGVGMLHPVLPLQRIVNAAQDYQYLKYLQSIGAQYLYIPAKELDKNGEQLLELKVAQSFHGAKNSYGLLKLSPGDKIEELKVGGPDRSLIDHERITATEIAAIAKIDQEYMNVTISGDSNSYKNIRDKQRDFYNNALRPVIKIIEETFTDLLPLGQRYVLDVSDLKPIDSTMIEAARWMADINKERKDGDEEYFTREEIRTKMGLSGDKV